MLPNRPISIFDETFRLTRKTIGVLLLYALVEFAIMAAVMLAPMVSYLNTMMNLAYGSALTADPYALFAGMTSALGSFTLAALLAGILSSIVQYGMLYSIRAATLNGDASLPTTIKLAFGRIGKIILQALLFGVILAGIYVALLIVLGILFGIGAASSGALQAIMIILGVLATIALCVFVIIFSIRISMYQFVNVYDDSWYIASLKRSFQVTRGSAGRIFGYSLLLALIIAIVSGVISTLFSYSSGALNVIGTLITFLIGAAASPIAMCLNTVLYLACLQRSEGTPFPDYQ